MRAWLATLGAVAGLMGAAGVALAAIGAHRSSNPSVTTAAYFLLFHAAAMAGFCGVARGRLFLLVSASLIATGAILFSGDLALRALTDVTLIRMAAPTGGVIMIVGWLATALALPLALSSSES